MQNKYTFWKLINESSIEIPIIQRDYAQGRNEDKVIRIRKKFLDILHERISSAISIDLDFVYGKVELIDNKNYFIPLDGQQRLTTLFLLHWYLAPKVDNKIKKEYQDILKKFTYKTRISSRDFCKYLVTESIEKIVYNEENKKLSLSDYIKEQKWFFESWIKDPTIKSMLVMLDEIDLKFNNKGDFFEKLISEENPPITFQYLPLDNFGLTDELYIKMNARGKTLTDFENFKANFERYLDKSDVSKMDNTWTDLFWEYKEKKDGYYFIDEKFLNFFTNMTLNLYVEKNDFNVKSKIDEINIFDVYEDVYKEKDNVERITKLLDSLCNIAKVDNKLNKYKEYFDVFIGHKDEDKKNDNELKLSYWDRARFYALSLFLIKYENINDSNIDILEEWLRITFNLINNQLIQSPELFINAIRGISELSKNMDNLYAYMSKQEKLLGFNDRQSKEEILKTKLILENNIWEELFIRAEKHWYLDGQIGFLLNYANDNSKYNTDLFKAYIKKFELLFIEDIFIDNEYLFQRALLSKGDYLPYYKSNYTFCSSETALRTKEDNWRKVFNDFEEESNISIILKELLDDILLEKDIKTNLQNIIDNFRENDWREGFVKNPLVINYCKRLQIRFENENDILLLSKERTSGIHAEYYSYYLYLQVKNKFKDIKIKYEDQNSIELEKYISIDDGQTKINYVKYNDAWQYKKIVNDKSEYFENQDELINSLSI